MCLSLLHLGVLGGKMCYCVEVKMWVVKRVVRCVNSVVRNVRSLAIVLSLLRLAAALWYAWGFL